MSDLLRLRDHNQPCRHEDKFAYKNDDWWACVVCPGGREVVLRKAGDMHGVVGYGLYVVVDE